MTLSLREIEKARERIAPHIVRTPLLRLKSLDEHLGCEVYAKPECMQVTGSFKFRGAMSKILSLSEDELKRGIVAASSGNHGKAIAYASRTLGIKATPPSSNAPSQACRTRFADKLSRRPSCCPTMPLK